MQSARIHFLLLLFLMLLPEFMQAQCQPWAKSLAADGNDFEQSLVLDEDGNAYLAGNYLNPLSVDGFLLPAPGWAYHAFLIKVDPAGNTLWAKAFPSNLGTYTPQLTWSAGGLIMAIDFQDSLRLDSLFFSTAPQRRSGIIARLAPDGSLQWVHEVLSPSLEISGLDHDGNDNIFMTGIFSDTLILPGGTTLTGTGNDPHCFVSKLSPSGMATWAIMDSARSRSYELKTDGQGNLYVAGLTADGVHWGNDQLVFSNNASRNLFFLKLSGQGSVLWLKGIATGNTIPRIGGITVDGADNPYLSLSFLTNVTLENLQINDAQGSALLTKWSPTGTLSWYRQAGRTTMPTSQYDAMFSPSLGPDGNLWVCGGFRDGSMIGNQVYNSAGIADFKLVTFDTAGTVLRVLEFPNQGATGAFDGVFDQGNGLVVAGYYTAPVIYLAGDTLTNTNASGNMTQEVFLARLCDSIVIASIPENHSEPQVRIYPSPGQGRLELYFEDGFSGEIRLLDLQGRVLWSREQVNVSQGQVIKIDLSGQATGVYLVEIRSGTSLVTKKIIKM